MINENTDGEKTKKAGQESMKEAGSESLGGSVVLPEEGDCDRCGRRDLIAISWGLADGHPVTEHFKDCYGDRREFGVCFECLTFALLPLGPSNTEPRCYCGTLKSKGDSPRTAVSVDCPTHGRVEL